MATLTPSFRDVLPQWLGRQQWYLGPQPAQARPVGFVRIEDPDGEVGIEAHLLAVEDVVYNVVLTYRAAPVPDGNLVVRGEHSELGTRWIYDAVGDPAWTAAVLQAVGGEGTRIETVRALEPGAVAGALMGEWRPDRPDGAVVSGALAIVRP